MGILETILGGSIAAPIDAVGNALDKIFTSDQERVDARIVLEKIKQHPAELQVELNKIEANHRTIFVAGWRPFIGWICGLSLAYEFIIQPGLTAFGIHAASLNATDLHTLIGALLGLGSLRTFEKFKGLSK